MMSSIVKQTVFVFIGSVLTTYAIGAEVEYEITIGAARSDNVARTDTFEIEETIALLGLALDVQHESRKVEASLVADLEYRNYTDGIFDDEVVGSLYADLELQLAQDVFSWVFENRFGNLVTNPFLANTPVNRQNINRFSTGPDLILRFGSRTALEVGGRYHNTQFEISDIDNDVLGGRVSLVRALSAHRSASLNITTDRIEFDDTTFNSSYDKQAAYFGFESESSRSTLTVNLGYNELHDNGVVTDGYLINVNWDREISPSTTFNLGYNEGLTDAGFAFDQSQPGQGFGDPQRTAGVSDPFENRRFSVGLDFNRNSNIFFATLSYNEDEYITASVLDRDRSSLRLGFSRDFGSAWRFRLSGVLQKTDFVTTGREDDDATISVGLSRQFSRKVGVNLNFTRFDRDSSDPGFNYVENVINLTFSYTRR